MNKSHLTALRRNKLSLPTKYLVEKKLLAGRVLDYGSGQGFDARAVGALPYDPHFQPVLKEEAQFETIYSNYVLNVIEDEDERALALLRIAHFLTNDGIAYITVRNDKKKLNGLAPKGTWQGLIQLNLPVEKKTAGWVMYRLTKNESLA